MRRDRGGLYTSFSWLHGRRTCAGGVPCGKGWGARKTAKTFGPNWVHGASSEALMTSRVSGHSTRLHGRSCWQGRRSRSQWARHFGPCFFCGNTMPLEDRAAQRYAKLAVLWELVLAAAPSVSRSLIRNRCASPPTSQPCPSTCRAGFGPGQVQKRTFTDRRVLCKSRNGYDGRVEIPAAGAEKGPYLLVSTMNDHIPAMSQFLLSPRLDPLDCISLVIFHRGTTKVRDSVAVIQESVTHIAPRSRGRRRALCRCGSRYHRRPDRVVVCFRV